MKVSVGGYQAHLLARMVLDYFGDTVYAYPAGDNKMIAMGLKAKEILGE